MNTKKFAARLLHVMARERGLNIEYREVTEPDGSVVSEWEAFHLGLGEHVWQARTWRSIEDALNYVEGELLKQEGSWAISLESLAGITIDEGPVDEGGFYLHRPQPSHRGGNWVLGSRVGE